MQEKLNKTESKTDHKSGDKQYEAVTDTAEPKQTEQAFDSTNVLVAYFSRADENYSVGTIEVGNTQILGEYIANEVGADSFHTKHYIIDLSTNPRTAYDKIFYHAAALSSSPGDSPLSSSALHHGKILCHTPHDG